ncbi:unnamed protein product [Allacma fusca]|uniref:Uncharacterized protein n=1 Tax=Allacma fusca TaxID=39272 RepID=A0A8J2KEL2_9HEXA|nr:unnamed protein product [Allacma fusca]
MLLEKFSDGNMVEIGMLRQSSSFPFYAELSPIIQDSFSNAISRVQFLASISLQASYTYLKKFYEAALFLTKSLD